MKRRARLVVSWGGGQTPYRFRQIERHPPVSPRHTQLLVSRLAVFILRSRVVEATGVSEQVADRDGMISGNGVVCPLAGGLKRFLSHAHLRELRKVLRYRIGERKLALFVKNHRGDACDGLCHRVHTHDGVGLISTPSLPEDDLTVPRDEARSTVQPASGYVFLHNDVNPAQAITGETSLSRINIVMKEHIT